MKTKKGSSWSWLFSHGPFDYYLLLLICVLTAMGLLVLYSASSNYALVKMEASDALLDKQIEAVALGFCAIVVLSFVNYRILAGRFISEAAFIGFFVMNVATFFTGNELNSSKRWLSVNNTSLQPVEFTKIALILLLAMLFSKEKKEETDKKDIAIYILILAQIALVAKNNLSSGIILFGIFMVEMFVAGKYPFIPVAAGLAAVAVYLNIERVVSLLGHILQPYQLKRIYIWLDPSGYINDGGEQVLKSIYSISSGGYIGKGIGSGVQKLSLPEAYNDTIFAVLCEELGMAGAGMLLFLYLLVIVRLAFIAASAKDQKGALIVTGVIAHLSIQVICNVAVATNMMPNTGITLPFVSQGGTAISCLMMELGLALSVARGTGER